MKQLLIIFCLVAVLLPGCNDSERIDGVEIRVRNVSTYDYEKVYVNTSGGMHDYGDLGAGETSPYYGFQSAYRYALVELVIGDSTYTIQPIDYVGETPLEDGQYTYEVGAAAAGGQYDRLTLELVVD